MKPFYSIVFCTIRPTLEERVSIGLFMADENGIYFRYSQEKLLAVKQLISQEAYNLVRTGLKSLSKLSNECRKDEILRSYKGNSLIKETYFNYLSKYSNNLITYSSPTTVDINLNQSAYNKLFEKFVHHITSGVPEKVKLVESVKKRLVKSIARHVSFDVELDKSKVPGLIVPAKVWFIGKNEVEVTGEAKDFSSPVHVLQQQINAHLFLLEKLKATPEGKNGKFFMIGDEPSRQLKENHSLWKNICEANVVDLVPTAEVQLIEEYMEVHRVEPVFQD